MKGKWTTALTNRSKKSSTTHSKPWSVNCVALWKSKGVTLKPTPTCVRRNNPGSQGETHCSRYVGSRRSFAAGNESVACCCQMYFPVPNKSVHNQLRSFPPNAALTGRRALPARGTFSAESLAKSCQTSSNSRFQFLFGSCTGCGAVSHFEMS